VIYLDYNATAPVRPEVVAAMQECLALPLNASSVHTFGREAKKRLEYARKTIAETMSAWPNELIFCGSGTEANNWALRAVTGRRVLVSAMEHSSVLAAAPEHKILIPSTAEGLVDLAALEALLQTDGVALVSVMLANNETGVIQPMAEVAALCRKYEALLHCDAVQGVGKIPVDFGGLGADMMTISGHKSGGPVGAAALVVRRGYALPAFLLGGGQESRRRAGTENIAAISGFAKAMELIDLNDMKRLRSWLAVMEQAMEAMGGVVFGTSAPRLPNTTCVAMPGTSGEVQLMDFDLKGFAVSTGSACSSGRIEGSHVLAAMNVPKNLAESAIRISGGWKTTEEDIILFTQAWRNTRKRLIK